MLTSGVVPAYCAQRLHADRLPFGWTESNPLLLLLYLLAIGLLSVVLLLLLLRVSEREQ